MDFQRVVRPRVWKREMICSPSLSAWEGGRGEGAKGVEGWEIVMFRALVMGRKMRWAKVWIRILEKWGSVMFRD